MTKDERTLVTRIAKALERQVAQVDEQMARNLAARDENLRRHDRDRDEQLAAVREANQQLTDQVNEMLVLFRQRMTAPPPAVDAVGEASE